MARGRVNLERAVADRADGMSVAQIARKQGVTESAIYYALNPERRKAVTPAGRMRSVYVRDELWDVVKAHAAKYGLSASSVLSSILEGELPLPARLAECLDAPRQSVEEIWGRSA